MTSCCCSLFRQRSGWPLQARQSLNGLWAYGVHVFQSKPILKHIWSIFQLQMCSRAADNSCGLLGALESYNNKIAKTDIRLFPDGGCEQGSGHQQADRWSGGWEGAAHQPSPAARLPTPVPSALRLLPSPPLLLLLCDPLLNLLGLTTRLRIRILNLISGFDVRIGNNDE